MLDVELLRNQPEKVKESIKKRGGDPGLFDSFLQLDQQWRTELQKAEALRSERNRLTQTKESAIQNVDQLKEIKLQLQGLEELLRQLELRRREAQSRIPQLIDPEVPVGVGETANTVIRKEGTVNLKSGRAHDELMTALGWLDQDIAAKTSGARFRYLKDKAALTHLKLVLKAIELAVSEGFTPVIPPVIVRDEILLAMGFFPVGEEDTFKVEDRYLTGTSEPMLVSLAGGSVHSADTLPLRYVGFSTCFRREAGSYGKDTKGMFRQHQFDKVEMVSICRPADSEKEHQFLVSMQERLVQSLGLPYQVVLVGSGDLESKATKRYDLETYFPGQEKYRETHSASNCGDYQARGFDIKYRDQDGREGYAHTLNATLVTERLLLALIENNQKEDGSVVLTSSLVG